MTSVFSAFNFAQAVLFSATFVEGETSLTISAKKGIFLTLLTVSEF